MGNTHIKDPMGESPRRFDAPSLAPLIKDIKGGHNLS